MATNTTNHYERDAGGQWWIVSSGDFPDDIETQRPCANSNELELAYQMGYEQGFDKGREKGQEDADAENALQ